MFSSDYQNLGVGYSRMEDFMREAQHRQLVAIALQAKKEERPTKAKFSWFGQRRTANANR